MANFCLQERPTTPSRERPTTYPSRPATPGGHPARIVGDVTRGQRTSFQAVACCGHRSSSFVPRFETPPSVDTASTEAGHRSPDTEGSGRPRVVMTRLTSLRDRDHSFD